MRKSTLLGGVALGVTLALGLGAAAQAQDLTVAWKGAPEFTNDDVKFKVRGRIYTDYVFQEIDGEYDPLTNLSGTGDYNTRNGRLRTARLGVEGQWNTQWAYKAEINFVAGNTVQWEDLILEYKPNDTTSIMIGNFKTVSLENITSSRYITMMERGAFNDVLDIGRVLNVAAKVNGINWTAMLAANGDSVNTADIAGEERLGWSFRGTFAPIDTDTTKLHLGVWARGRDFGDEGMPANALTGQPAGGSEAGRYRLRNNTNVGDRYIDSGSNFAESDLMFAVEAAWVYNSFSVQGEYAHVEADKRCFAVAPGAVNPCSQGADQGDVDAYYVTASWFPTGEMRRYEANRGEFNRTRILNPVTAGGTGAVELAVRYDNVDLSGLQTVRRFTGPGGPVDVLGPVDRGGEYQAITLGANWYPFPYVRFMANYTMAENDNPQIVNPLTLVAGPDRDVDVDTLQFRAQFDF